MLVKKNVLMTGPQSHLHELHGDRYDGQIYANDYTQEFKKCLDAEQHCDMLIKPIALR